MSKSKKQSKGQMELVPSKLDKGEHTLIRLIELPETFVGPEPDAGFVESVKKYGVIQPIVVVKQADGSYVVAAGRRRVKAARECGHDTIGAIVHKASWASEDVLTLIENEHRRKNIAADVAAIAGLVERNASPKEIAEATGLRLQTVKKLHRIVGMGKVWVKGVVEGKVKAGAAVQAAALPVSYRKELTAKLEKGERIKGKDVKQARCARKESEAQTLSAILTDTHETRMHAFLNAMGIPFKAVQGVVTLKGTRITFGKDGRFAEVL